MRSLPALDSGTDAKGRPILADRLATFYNAVGRLVYEKCPDKLLGAYVFYGGDLPKRTAVFRNIYLSSPYNEISTLFFNADYRRTAYDQIRAWGKLCRNMSFYSAYHGSGFWSFPYSSTPLLADLFPVLKAADNKGITFYGVEGWVETAWTSTWPAASPGTHRSMPRRWRTITTLLWAAVRAGASARGTRCCKRRP